MPQIRVVILSGQKLFADGLANRLHQRLDALDLTIADPGRPDALGALIALDPSVVIMDASDSNASLACPVAEILAAVPSARLIRLDPLTDSVQVLSSIQHAARHVDDLIEVITGVL